MKSIYNSVLTTQEYLDRLASEDRFGFLQHLNTWWESHRPLLYLCLSLCPGVYTQSNVVELGSGEGSTPYLRKYCQYTDRSFTSYESKPDWATKMGTNYVSDWETDLRWQQPCSLLFVDNAPGEYRHVAVDKMRDKADIIVMHDTELNGAGAYNYEYLWPTFRYVLHFNRIGGGAGASAVSNTIDLNRFKFCELGGYKFE